MTCNVCNPTQRHDRLNHGGRALIRPTGYVTASRRTISANSGTAYVEVSQSYPIDPHKGVHGPAQRDGRRARCGIHAPRYRSGDRADRGLHNQGLLRAPHGELRRRNLRFQRARVRIVLQRGLPPALRSHHGIDRRGRDRHRARCPSVHDGLFQRARRRRLDRGLVHNVPEQGHCQGRPHGAPCQQVRPRRHPHGPGAVDILSLDVVRTQDERGLRVRGRGAVHPDDRSGPPVR